MTDEGRIRRTNDIDIDTASCGGIIAVLVVQASSEARHGTILAQTRETPRSIGPIGFKVSELWVKMTDIGPLTR